MVIGGPLVAKHDLNFSHFIFHQFLGCFFKLFFVQTFYPGLTSCFGVVIFFGKLFFRELTSSPFLSFQSFITSRAFRPSLLILISFFFSTLLLLFPYLSRSLSCCLFGTFLRREGARNSDHFGRSKQKKLQNRTQSVPAGEKKIHASNKNRTNFMEPN